MDCAGRNERGIADKKEGERLFPYCTWGLFNKKIVESGEQRAELGSSPPSQLLSPP